MPLLIAVAAVAVLWPRGAGSPAAPGGFLVDDMGRPTPIATRTGPATLVHFWATWCPPCLTEVPALQRLAKEFRAEPGLQVVMIAVEDTPEHVKTFLARLQARGAQAASGGGG